MADASAAARREARRRRILENSENRMQRIFGTCKDEPVEGKLENSASSSKPQVDNGFVTSKNHLETKNKVTPDDKRNDNLEQGSTLKDSSSKKAFSETKSQYSQPDNHFAFRHTDEQYSLKSNLKDCDNFNFNPTTPSFEQAPCKENQCSFLSTLFFSPLSCILLAVFVNILLLADVNFSLYNGIIPPYIVLAITRLCLENKSEETQGSNMLVAALILCNIKPDIVYSFKKVMTICSAISRDFALYLTSFVLFNWIISILWTGSNFVQFF